MNSLIKYWLLGVLIIIGFFLSLSSPENWEGYIGYLMSNSIWAWISQSGFLLIGGAVLGASIYIAKDVFF